MGWRVEGRVRVRGLVDGGRVLVGMGMGIRRLGRNEIYIYKEMLLTGLKVFTQLESIPGS